MSVPTDAIEVEIIEEEEDAQIEKEFFIRSRIYNNLMRTARIAAGYKTCAALSRACGLSIGQVCELEAFKKNPRKKSFIRVGVYEDGGWSRAAEAISRGLKILPEDLWPKELWLENAKPEEIQLSIEDVSYMLGQGTIEAAEDPAELYEKKEMVQNIHKAIALLRPREAAVIRMRFGIGDRTESTLEECGEAFEVTRENVRQREAKALRHLRHPWLMRAALEGKARRPPEVKKNKPGPLPGAMPKYIKHEQACITCGNKFMSQSEMHKCCGPKCRPSAIKMLEKQSMRVSHKCAFVRHAIRSFSE